MLADKTVEVVETEAYESGVDADGIVVAERTCNLTSCKLLDHEGSEFEDVEGIVGVDTALEAEG